jgi:hypothetical protein
MQKWIMKCPSEEKFNAEVEDQRLRIEELEASFEEPRIKEYLNRVAISSLQRDSDMMKLLH